MKKAALLAVWTAALVATACHSPVKSQEYFVQAAADDRALRPIYSTALYTVFFDDALMRCVVHAGHTWGEGGGGGGGTGIGIEAFRCDPHRIAARARDLGLKTYGNFPALQPAPSTVRPTVSAPAPMRGVISPSAQPQGSSRGRIQMPTPGYTPAPAGPRQTAPAPEPDNAAEPSSQEPPALGAPLPIIRPDIPDREPEGDQ